MAGISLKKKRWGFGPAFFLLLQTPSVEAADDWNVIGQTRVQVISEPEPVRDMLKNWGDGFDRGKRQWLTARAEIGARYSTGLEVTLFSRALADLRINPEAAEFYGSVKKEEELVPGQRVPVAVSAEGFVGHGLRIGYSREGGSWEINVGASLFKASYLLSGDVWGEMAAVTPEEFTFEANVDYAYYKDLLFGRGNTDEPNGIGWSGDLAAEWEPAQWVRMKVRIEDLFANIRWSEVPTTKTIGPVSLDKRIQKGKKPSAGAWSESEYYRYDQEFDPRFNASITLSRNVWSASIYGKHQFGYGYAGFGVGHQFVNGMHLSSVYWPKYDELGL